MFFAIAQCRCCLSKSFPLMHSRQQKNLLFVSPDFEFWHNRTLKVWCYVTGENCSFSNSFSYHSISSPIKFISRGLVWTQLVCSKLQLLWIQFACIQDHQTLSPRTPLDSLGNYIRKKEKCVVHIKVLFILSSCLFNSTQNIGSNINQGGGSSSPFRPL